MQIYIYELGLLRTGYVKDVSEDDLNNYILVGDYNLITIGKDLTETRETIKAYIKRATN